MTDALKLGSQEVQGLFGTNGLRFTVLRGGPQSLADFRGEDDIVPEASGRDPGVFIADTRALVLHGFVAGTGSTAQAIRQSFATNFALLVAVMNPASLITVTAYPPNFGLTTGTTAVLANVRPQRIVGPEPSDLWYEGWEGNIELVCIDSPPDWTIA